MFAGSASSVGDSIVHLDQYTPSHLSTPPLQDPTTPSLQYSSAPSLRRSISLTLRLFVDTAEEFAAGNWRIRLVLASHG
jgi:hypothetical protein